MATTLNDANEIYNKVKQDTGMTDTELSFEIEKIKTKYQGLLSEVGANIMLAKSLNVNLDLKKTNSVLKISEINPSLDGVSIYARVKSIFPIKTFTGKDGGIGTVQSIYLEDDTGTIRLSLWHDKTSLIQELNLDKNSLVFIKDAYVSTYNDKTELSLRQGGSITLEPNNSLVPKLSEKIMSLSDISSAYDFAIDVIGRVTNVYPEKEFVDKDGKSRKLISIELSDGKRNIRCTSFDTHVEFIKTNLMKGDLIKLCDVKVKDGLYDQEININWNSTIIRNPKTKEVIPPLKDMLLKKMEKTSISEITENKPCILEGVIISINKNKLRYFKCPTCQEKIQSINGEFICEKCNKSIDPIINLFGSIDLDDGTGVVRIVFFNDIATKLYSLNPQDLKKELTEEEKNEIFDTLEANLAGKKISITGRGKMNNFSGKIEFLCDSLEII